MKLPDEFADFFPQTTKLPLDIATSIVFLFIGLLG